MERVNRGSALMWVIVALVVVVGGFSILGGKGGAPSTETSPIKIGVIGPLTGDAAIYGEPFRNTVQLAIDEINATGGIGGRQVEAIYEDGQCNGKEGANAAQKLVNVDKVQAIIGGVCSGETLTVVPIAEKGRVVVVSPSASSPALTGISPYFFRPYPSDASQGNVLANIAYTDKGWKKVAVIQEQVDYAVGLYKVLNQVFSGLGGKTVKEEFSSNVTDFRSVLTKLKAEKPDALFVLTQTAASTQRILKQMEELNWKPQIILDEASAGDKETLTTYKSQLEGALTSEFIPDLSNAKLQKLMSDYKAKYGTELPYLGYMAPAYDIVYILKNGIASVGYNGEKLATWSRTIKDWQGASGSVTISSDGDRGGGDSSEVVHDGKTEPYKK